MGIGSNENYSLEHFQQRNDSRRKFSRLRCTYAYVTGKYFYTTNLPKYYPETQLKLMPICLFYKLCYPLPHGFISSTTWSVPIAHYCSPYQLYRAWQRSMFSKQN